LSFAEDAATAQSLKAQRKAAGLQRPADPLVEDARRRRQSVGNQAMLGGRGKGPGAMAPLVLSLPGLVGNQAVKRVLENKIPLGIGISGLRDLQSALRPRGVRRMQALPRLKPEDLQGAIPLQLPPEFDLGSLRPSGDKNNDFIVESDEFGVTIVHPASETRIRVVEKEHRYKPEEWSYETVKYPKETPAISYQLIAPEEGKPGEVLIAVGPGAFVEVEEPAPFEGAKEWELVNWQPRMGGNFNVTIVEMPNKALVPLPNEDIDVEMLLKAGGIMHYPDKHTWRGAVSYQEYVMTIGMLIGELLFAAIPLAAELAEAVALASEAAAFAPELGETAALGGLEAGTSPPTGAALEDLAASPITSEIANEEGLITETGLPIPKPEPAAGQLPGETTPVAGENPELTEETNPPTTEPEPSVGQTPAEPAPAAEETPQQQYYRGQKRARRAASKRGIELRKRIAYERLSKHQFDPLQELLSSDELEAFLESEGEELPKNIDWHHTVQTSQDPGMADVPEHIQPVRYTEHVGGEHLGDPGGVPTAGLRADVTTPEQPIYDPNAPELQARRYNSFEPTGEQTLEEQGFSKLPARKPPNFRNFRRVAQQFRNNYDFELRGPKGEIFRRHIASGKWVLFPN
jgi:hypothetical protein